MKGDLKMLTAQKTKVFTNDNMYAVNIPQEFDLNVEEVYINKIGDVLMITPVGRLAGALERGAEILAAFSPDFMAEGRPESITAIREEL